MDVRNGARTYACVPGFFLLGAGAGMRMSLAFRVVIAASAPALTLLSAGALT